MLEAWRRLPQVLPIVATTALSTVKENAREPCLDDQLPLHCEDLLAYREVESLLRMIGDDPFLRGRVGEVADRATEGSSRRRLQSPQSWREEDPWPG
jgi:hypothetical protein